MHSVMLKIAVAFGTAALTSATQFRQMQAGSGCACLTGSLADQLADSFDSATGGTLEALVNGTTTAPYPTTYGMDSCEAHDAGTSPWCDQGDDSPGWCASEWCFVDIASCDDVATDSSSYFAGSDPILYYSYETCSATNTFSNSLQDSQACNAEHSAIAAHCTNSLGHAFANSRCPCIDVNTAGVQNTAGDAFVVALDGTDYDYPLGYGLGNCGPHDAILAPYCADATGAMLGAAPGWCTSNWCFVDVGNCQLVDENNTAIAPSPSSYFHVEGAASQLMYSYETCSHSNTFQDTEQDPQACNDQHSDVVADHCVTTGHAAADAACPCLSAWTDPAARTPFMNTAGDAFVVALGGADYEYPLGYGLGACGPHDAMEAPYCADATGAMLADAPGWCTSNWCFVDVDNCVGYTPDNSSYFPDAVPLLTYSYETCSHQNTFIGTVHDPTATQLGGTATYEVDITTIAPGSAARNTFEVSFKTAVVAAMLPTVLEASAVDINSIVAGSAVVDYTVYVPAAAAAAATVTFAAIAPSALTVSGVAPAIVVRAAVTGSAVNCVETAPVAADCLADCATLSATVTTAAANGGTACAGATLDCAAGDGACPAAAPAAAPAPAPSSGATTAIAFMAAAVIGLNFV